MKKLLLLFIIPCLLFVISCNDNNYIDTVKYGYFDRCQSGTVGAIVNKYVKEPSWDTYVADDGQRVVNLYGKDPNLNYSKIWIQFDIYPNERWEVYSIEVNNYIYDEYEIYNFIDKMCLNY